MSQPVRSMFGRIAPTYDLLNHVLSAGVDRRWRERLVAGLGLEGEGGDVTVLDLCAGTLDVARVVTRRVPGARVAAVDFARPMLLAGARKIADGQDGDGRITVAQADALVLPFADRTFAAATCAFGVRNLDDPAAGLRETHRVLRPGGRFGVLEFFRPEGRARRALHALYERTLLPAIGGLLSGDRGAYRYLASSMERFLPRGEYEALGRQAGFSVVTSEALWPGVAALVVLRKEA